MSADHAVHLRAERAWRDAKLENNVSLTETLRFVVPLQIWDLQRYDPKTRRGLAREDAVNVGSHGDALQFGGKQSALAFNALSRGLAALAYEEGGVTFAGLHWCVGAGHRGTDDPAPCAAETQRLQQAEGGEA